MKTLTTIILFLVGSHCFATNYYISNTGSNAANGLSPATAWQTLSKITSITVASALQLTITLVTQVATQPTG